MNTTRLIGNRHQCTVPSELFTDVFELEAHHIGRVAKSGQWNGSHQNFSVTKLTSYEWFPNDAGSRAAGRIPAPRIAPTMVLRLTSDAMESQRSVL